MNRRALLSVTAGTAASATAGCLGRLPAVGSSVSTEFELVDADLDPSDDPDVTVEDGTVVARGTIEYGSSECGTVELAHAAYEGSQERLDLLVVAADDSSGVGGCSDDLVYGGYRLEASVEGLLRRVTVTEHHVFGDAYSTTVDGLDD
ncbi:hypothetical protein [Natronorubrum bangense]|uniref:Lipoprotein n=1 Tax=Natronorubrum bangense TaxID=61858 RepID=A0A4D6HPL2_9EURY|nr:hypothetical protein [Natronorubrum bangense]QCC55136.1 hypothetical protein DV706_12045 [Natronorubrum bangense]